MPNCQTVKSMQLPRNMLTRPIYTIRMHNLNCNLQKNKNTDTLKQVEAAVALVISDHCSILSCDHISSACKVAFPDSSIVQNYQIHCTKCTGMWYVINGVLAPYFLQLLAADIVGNKYSLLLNESMDVSVSKHLGIVIHYFSKKREVWWILFLAFLSWTEGMQRPFPRHSLLPWSVWPLEGEPAWQSRPLIGNEQTCWCSWSSKVIHLMAKIDMLKDPIN